MSGGGSLCAEGGEGVKERVELASGDLTLWRRPAGRRLTCRPLTPPAPFLFRPPSSSSFHGGTDVDRPLQLSLERLKSAEWSRADILMVTDGEINPPSEDLLAALDAAREELGLEVHGLLVSGRASDAMQRLCTDLHVFKSWTAVGAEGWQYQ